MRSAEAAKGEDGERYAERRWPGERGVGRCELVGGVADFDDVDRGCGPSGRLEGEEVVGAVEDDRVFGTPLLLTCQVG